MNTTKSPENCPEVVQKANHKTPGLICPALAYGRLAACGRLCVWGRMQCVAMLEAHEKSRR